MKRSRLESAIPVALAMLAAACGLTPPPEPPRQQPTAPPTEVPANTNPDALPPPGYRLVWQDEFEGSALGSAWSALSAPRLDAIATPDAAQVHDGLLTLTTYTDASGKHHTGFLSTQGTVEMTYGYFEARIRFNDSPGEWCAFWIDSPTNGDPMGDPGKAGVEIDVVEHRATDDHGWTALKDMSAMNLNWDRTASSRQNVQKVVSLPGNAPIQGEWHVFGVMWTETGYTFYVDGLPAWTTAAALSHRSEYLQLTCEVADASWAGYVPAGGYGSRVTSTTRMDVDWVRVWQKS
ncbi:MULTISPECIES: glycoside hydrolase family 16 protein [unclassified Anaeromyxobacter]|uniref:glycoside hydrolase family 16 protein n=1 Tax=unclassified Anaeromyxobacter TaxID=2620896 RepID=UPI001F5A2D0B|nr:MULTISPECIES: glycoside hydrolase family 16 protein [unclassified Anaeromyxobacter]